MNTAQDKYCKEGLKLFSRLAGYKAKSGIDYLHFVLDETIDFSGSRSGFFFTVDRTGDINLVCKLDSQESISGNVHEKALTGIVENILSKEEKGFKVPVLLNESDNVLHLKESAEKPDSLYDRVCIIPVIIENNPVAFVAFAERITDYEDDEAVLLQLVITSTWNIYEQYLEKDKVNEKIGQAEAKAKLLERFASNASHEIRTKVNAIMGFASLLAENISISGIDSKYLQIVLKSSGDLKMVTDDFEEISTLDQKLSKIHLQGVSISKIIEELFENFRNETEGKDIKLGYRFEPEDREIVLITDPDKYRYIVSSLINNSLKFTSRGKIDIVCRIINEFVEFKIVDTGRGIPAELQPGIFNYLSHDYSILSKSLEGTGVSLVVSYEYVKHLGGDMWFKSKEGEGSVFYFTLPYIRSEIPDKPFLRSSDEKKNKRNGEKIILVAEDDDISYFIIEKFIKRDDIKILRALNGKEAVDLCKTKHIDLVLMDIKMPVMDGFEATGLIRKFKPDLKIIAQTAFISDRGYAISCGCTDFIAKPFRKEQLVSLINSYL